MKLSEFHVTLRWHRSCNLKYAVSTWQNRLIALLPLFCGAHVDPSQNGCIQPNKMFNFNKRLGASQELPLGERGSSICWLCQKGGVLSWKMASPSLEKWTPMVVMPWAKAEISLFPSGFIYRSVGWVKRGQYLCLPLGRIPSDIHSQSFTV